MNVRITFSWYNNKFYIFKVFWQVSLRHWSMAPWSSLSWCSPLSDSESGSRACVQTAASALLWELPVWAQGSGEAVCISVSGPPHQAGQQAGGRRKPARASPGRHSAAAGTGSWGTSWRISEFILLVLVVVLNASIYIYFYLKYFYPKHYCHENQGIGV